LAIVAGKLPEIFDAHGRMVTISCIRLSRETWLWRRLLGNFAPGAARAFPFVAAWFRIRKRAAAQFREF